MLWFIVILWVVALAIIACTPDGREFIRLVRQAVRDWRNKKPPMAGV